MILFDDSYLLLGKSYHLDDNIIIKNPIIGEIFDFGEEKYYSTVLTFISKPSDFKIQFSNIGIDFETISDFDFFNIMIKNITPDKSKILFGELDLSKMELYVKNDSEDKIIMYDDIIINELAYQLISDFIRRINGIPIKKPEKFANEHVKKYIMEMERNKLRYAKKEPFKSVLIPLVSGLVNCSKSSYDYKSILDLKISQLHDAISRVQKIKNHDNIMTGIYSGTIQADKINQEEINWLV